MCYVGLLYRLGRGVQSSDFISDLQRRPQVHPDRQYLPSLSVLTRHKHGYHSSLLVPYVMFGANYCSEEGASSPAFLRASSDE